MALSLVTAPTAEPVSVPEAKVAARIDIDTDDDYIAALLIAARQHLDGPDGWLGRALMLSTWDLKLDAFPSVLRLPLAPVASVTSITYLDTAGVSQTLSSALYVTDLVTEPARLTPLFGGVWPSTYRQVNAVTVRFVAGYYHLVAAVVTGSPADVPEPIRMAIKALVAHWYEHREPVLVGTISEKLPMHVEALLAPYRMWPIECAA